MSTQDAKRQLIIDIEKRAQQLADEIDEAVTTREELTARIESLRALKGEYERIWRREKEPGIVIEHTARVDWGLAVPIRVPINDPMDEYDLP